MSLRQTLSFVLLALISLLSLASLPAPAQDKYAATERQRLSREPEKREARLDRRLEEGTKPAAERNEKRAEERAEDKKTAESSRDAKAVEWSDKHPIINGTIWAVVLIAMGIYVIGHIMLLIAAFRRHVLWGLFSLFVPIIGFLFMIGHWNDAKKAAWWMGIGVAIGLLAFSLDFALRNVIS